ncbi:MAG: hypothetical protein MRJ93_10185 [Nitrososphaeraceae archaeon]|nr:hypothetical protein [Nitrososphaeraceae archaeon]
MKINNLSSISFLSTLSILVAFTSLTISVYAQEDRNTTDSEMPKFFAIQHATSGKISEINETTYSLELNDVSDKTILFSDRPDRIVKTESTTNFTDNWSTGADSFAVDTPNAVLVVEESERQDNTIIELFNPTYDSNKKTLKYNVIPDNVTSIDLVGEFGQATLLIDPGGQSGPGT